MKIRFFAALLAAALSIALLGCTAAAETPPASRQATIPDAQVPESPTPALGAPKLITRDEATAIALADAGFTADQVARLHTEFDFDEGRPEYDVEFHQGSYEYSYEIHAETGAILSRSKERES